MSSVTVAAHYDGGVMRGDEASRAALIREQLAGLDDGALLELVGEALATRQPPRVRQFRWWLVLAGLLAGAAVAVGVWGGVARPFAAAPAVLAVAIVVASAARWLTPLEPGFERCPVCTGRVGVRHARGTCSRGCEAEEITDGGV